ncbi:hypothetical protein BMR02_02550 [Methylococcaceae bacterium HT1]|nr:hypothetical protein BMR02_02550 [Methylococcaceae bacterium HT1]TXL18691.1 hypothetical protein BMR04_00735 [Methylococcaceae bacterium HT3]TXL23831.1 hypothetical protein BMR03_00420 [Methylococcaceae bacterium HT2]
MAFWLILLLVLFLIKFATQWLLPLPSGQNRFTLFECLFVNVEVAYARPDRQLIISLQVLGACTVEQAIELSGINVQFPEIDLSKNKVGIFSQTCLLSTQLQEHDRVEIYRNLTIDPMEARRQRAVRQGR